jgi:hypothetical protein
LADYCWRCYTDTDSPQRTRDLPCSHCSHGKSGAHQQADDLGGRVSQRARLRGDLNIGPWHLPRPATISVVSGAHFEPFDRKTTEKPPNSR